jgi:hypothetical protein
MKMGQERSYTKKQVVFASRVTQGVHLGEGEGKGTGEEEREL